MTGDHRKKHRFNLVDVFLILVLILCVVGIVLRSNLEETLLTETKQVTLTCRVATPLTDDARALLTDGTALYLADGTHLGTCGALRTTEATAELPTVAGDLHTVVLPNQAIVTFDITCTVYITESGFALGSTSLDCNRTLQLHTSLLTVDAVILSISDAS